MRCRYDNDHFYAATCLYRSTSSRAIQFNHRSSSVKILHKVYEVTFYSHNIQTNSGPNPQLHLFAYESLPLVILPTGSELLSCLLRMRAF